MIRRDDHKLIVYPYAGVKRLFNLVEDPQEMKDLAADPEQKERMDSMYKALVALQVSMGDTLVLAEFF